MRLGRLLEFDEEQGLHSCVVMPFILFGRVGLKDDLDERVFLDCYGCME